jgi:pimeloyl-ACP methyl ester carboxylesterase
MRLDVVLHGRAAQMTEAGFLAGKGLPQRSYLQLEVFGRTNNAYRWAGETDVFEALESVRSHYNVDPQRIVLRGFSMGGAGAWHLGLHYPDRWAAIEAGAGFNETGASR